jgi:hypothetical protein
LLFVPLRETAIIRRFRSGLPPPGGIKDESMRSWWRLASLAWCGCWLALTAGCHSIQFGRASLDKIEQSAQAAKGPAPPSKYSFSLLPYIFRSDFEVHQDQPIFRELAGLRDQVYKELQLPAGQRTINVYLFEDREHYQEFMQAKYPDLPKRRAFFVAQPRVGGTEDLLVYTYWGKRIQEDLRHELTHALLHSVLKDVPLWLDEGIAENFEVPPEWQGVNYRHLDQIRRVGASSISPDLPRLEQLNQVQQMSPAEYREAWAWVHLLLHDKSEAKAVLLNYLQQLRVNVAPGPISPQLAAIYPSLNEALSRHLAELEASSLNMPRTPVGD